MAQGAANGRLTRDVNDDVRAVEKAANQSRQESIQRNSFAEAGKVSATFGYRLDERMHAYSGAMNQFGCPGNTVDHWRVQFIGREASLKAANAKINRK